MSVFNRDGFPRPATRPAEAVPALDIREAALQLAVAATAKTQPDRAAIKMLIDSFIRTTKQREGGGGGGGGPNRNRFPRLLINSDGN